MQRIKFGTSLEAYQCSKCKKICKSQRGLVAHERTHPDTSLENSSVTPQLLTCDVCFKQFRSRSGLSKHLVSHINNSQNADSDEMMPASNPVTSDTTASVPSDDFWNDELIRHFQENGDDFFTGGDEEEEALREALITGSDNQNLTPAPKPNGVVIRCRDCKSGFKSIDGYLKHRMRHAMQAAYAQAPSEEKVQEHCLELAEVVLSEMEKTELRSTVAVEVARISGSLKGNLEDAHRFFSEMCGMVMQCFSDDRDFFLVSKLIEAFQTHVAACVVDKQKREKLFHILETLVLYHSDIGEVFLSGVIRRFSRKILAFIIRYISKGEHGEATNFSTKYVTSSERTDTLEFKNLMHYIGGSNVKSILRRLLQSQNPSEESEKLLFTIRNNFLITSLSNAPDPELRAWTDVQDRGGLTKINSDLLNFFVALGNVVKDLERADGSLLTEDVVSTVCCQKNMVFMWDDIVKQTLSDEESFKLLYALLLQFSITWRKGIVTRRLDLYKSLNALQNQKNSSGGVAFRAQLM